MLLNLFLVFVKVLVLVLLPFSYLVQLPLLKYWVGFFSLESSLDVISGVFLGFLLVVVYSVFQFAYYYIKEVKFLILLGGFVISMILLLIGGGSNLFSYMMGWDWLGAVSFWLVCFFTASGVSHFSALKTYKYNRFGDGLFLFLFGGFCLSLKLNLKLLDWGVLCSIIWFMGCSTKSALFPFSSWLPYAMAAPTPVSALVHSSTLVTAGLYVLLRSGFGVKIVWIIVGVLTCVGGGFAGFLESDLKKIVAYSTLSQLGLMILFYSVVGNPLFLLYYMLAHATFKALLFVVCGGFLLNHTHNQDVRGLVGLVKNPHLEILLLLSLFCLSGFPLMSVFVMKEEMIFGMSVVGGGVFLCLFLSSFISELYSLKLIFKLYKKMNSPKPVQVSGEFSLMMLFPLFLLMVFCCGGFSSFLWEKKSLGGFCLLIFIWGFVGVVCFFLNFNFSMGSSLLFLHKLGLVSIWEVGGFWGSLDNALFGGVGFFDNLQYSQFGYYLGVFFPMFMILLIIF